MKRVVMLLMAVSCMSCTTVFIGSAKIKGGAAGCQAECQGLGMELAGMVVMGEYSNGCICQAPGHKVDVPQAAAAGAEPAVVGVALQQQQQQQSQTNSSHGQAY